VSDLTTRRITRELFLAAVGENFGTFEPWVTDRLTSILEEEEVAAGDCIYAAGEPPDHFYFVRQGRLELVYDGKPPETINGPRAFGMLDALVERPRSHSAYARMPLHLLRVRVDAWLELLEDSFELARMSVLGLTRAVAVLEERAWAGGRHVTPAAPAPQRDGGPKLDIVERVALLMDVPPLRGAGVQPLSDLATASEELSFAAGEHLFVRNAHPDRVFVLIDGSVEAHREDPALSRQDGPGQVVCGIGALAGRGADWEACAVTRVRALAFFIDDWFDVMEENFEMVRATLAALAKEHERLAVGPT
jgi:CRP-like cAMP-binding protein